MNGEDEDCWIYETVYPGTRAVDSISLWKDDMEEDLILSAEVGFSAEDDDFDTVLETQLFSLPMG